MHQSQYTILLMFSPLTSGEGVTEGATDGVVRAGAPVEKIVTYIASIT